MQQIGTKQSLLRKFSKCYSTGLKKFFILPHCVQKQLFREINDLPYAYVDYFKKADAA